MKRLIMIFILLMTLAVPASALEIEAPKAPDSAADLMPTETASFGESLLELLQNVVKKIRPDIAEATRASLSVVSAAMMVSLLKSFSERAFSAADLAGTVMIAASLFLSLNSLIRLGADTVTELSEYGKLLLPVMTAAMAAQGAGTASAALYTGTAVFDMVLSSLIANLLVPMVYLYLALAAANSATGEELLKKMRDFVKWLVSWCLKTILTVFTTYMSITGVVSGATDAAVLKAAKVTISSVVPVVGGILSDASEAVLVSAGLMKNAAGIYGILVILAVFLEPFLRIGIHYMIMKVTAAVCGLFGTKRITDLIEDFSTAMGLLLAMTGSACLLLLISTVCFLKGVG